MKPQRSVIVLGVMLAALLVWLVVRSHLQSPSSPSKTDSVSAVTPGPTQGAIPATRTPPPEAPTPGSALPSPAQTPGAQIPTPSQAVRPSVSPNGAAPVATDTTAAASESASINAIKVRRMITDYHTLTGENPVGTNAEIMAAVMGKNPRQAVLGPPDGLGLNAQGELVDDWGTPYFFHQLSKDVMEIHSAGADRIMGTADDVIVR